jgi:hypothetical protein
MAWAAARLPCFAGSWAMACAPFWPRAGVKARMNSFISQLPLGFPMNIQIISEFDSNWFEL